MVDEFRDFDWDPIAGGYRLRELDGGNVLWLVQRLFTWALMVGPDGSLGYEKHWCYETCGEAVRGALEWDGKHPDSEPQGWIRDPYTARVRPGGDPAREYISP